MDILDRLMNGWECAGPAAEQLIQAAEESLGIRFPERYRDFLLRYGAARTTGVDIAGLFLHPADEPPEWEHVASATMRLRRAAGGSFDPHLLYISSDGGDYYYYLDTSRPTSEGDCPVIVLGPGADGVVVANGFIDFIHRLVERTLDRWRNRID